MQFGIILIAFEKQDVVVENFVEFVGCIHERNILRRAGSGDVCFPEFPDPVGGGHEFFEGHGFQVVHGFKFKTFHGVFAVSGCKDDFRFAVQEAKKSTPEISGIRMSRKSRSTPPIRSGEAPAGDVEGSDQVEVGRLTDEIFHQLQRQGSSSMTRQFITC